MAQYTVQDPQGNNRIIEGPDGATDQEIIDQAQKLFGMSGGMTDNTSPNLYLFNKAIAEAKLQRKQNPQSDLSVTDNPPAGVEVPPEQRLLQNLNTVGAGYGAGQLGIQLGRGLFNAGSKAANWLAGLKNSYDISKEAPIAAGLETPSEAGTIIDTAKDAQEMANKTLANKLYSLIPKDTTIPLNTTQSAADSILNEVKELPPSFQENKILKMVGDLQNLDETNIGTLQTLKSTLGDIAANGNGVEKVYAARLAKALQADLESFGQTPALKNILSQQPSLEAQDLRRLWVNNANETTQPTLMDRMVQGAYVNPETFQAPAGTLSNADIPTNLSKANAYYKSMADLNNSPIAKALDRASLESKANVIFGKGRLSDVLNGQAVLGDQGFQAAQGQFYQKILKSPDIGKTLGKYTPEFLQAALGPKLLKILQAVDTVRQVSSQAAVGAKVGLGGTAAYKLYQLAHRH